MPRSSDSKKKSGRSWNCNVHSSRVKSPSFSKKRIITFLRPPARAAEEVGKFSPIRDSLASALHRRLWQLEPPQKAHYRQLQSSGQRQTALRQHRQAGQARVQEGSHVLVGNPCRRRRHWDTRGQLRVAGVGSTAFVGLGLARLAKALSLWWRCLK